MKKISIMILLLVIALASCKKTPEVNLQYVDVERDLITVGTTTATVQCDYEYITTLKKAFFYYGEDEDETDMSAAEMRVVQNTLYVDLTGLKENTTYSYYYEFVNGFNSMRTKAKTFKTEVSPVTPPAITLPTVVTAAVTEITTNSAKSGGEVTNNGGAEVTERGICWSTNANPTITDSHVASGSGTGTFTSTLTGLAANTTYHVRAYAINEKGTAYGLDKEFKTLSSGGGGGEHEYVDLGLPSGTLWATCNVGANSPEEYGDYFAWGETQPKDVYDWSTYKYCNGSISTLTKYCDNPDCGYNGFTDNLTTLLPEDDAAAVNWGDNWRMPSKADFEELYNNTTMTWTQQNGVNGRLFTSSNGNSLFLPAAGYYEGSSLNLVGCDGNYQPNSFLPNDPNCAYRFDFGSDPGHCYIYYGVRSRGNSVRAVRSGVIPPTPPGSAPEGAINGLFSVSPTQKVYFSQGNLQYQASTNTWRFAEHQWDYVGDETLGTVYVDGIKCDNTLISPTYDGWIDLFGWGTSGWNSGALCYQPWSVSCRCYDYYPGGNNNNNLFGEYANADWGVFNAIINGGNQSKCWRTLRQEEFDYVFNVRNTLSGIRYVKAIVDGINGVVLLPDSWNNSYFLLNNPNQNDSDFSVNILSILQWNTIEQYGAVFLPAAGVRDGTYLIHVNINGDYWAASSIDYRFSWGVEFYNSCCWVDNNNLLYNGRSVRLVHDANP
jgi:hypothetical protein